MGRTYESWSINDSGQASHGHSLDDKPMPKESRLDAPTAAFEAVVNDLKPVERRMLTGVACDEVIRHQSSFTVTWARRGSSTSFNVYYGCQSSGMAEIQTAIANAHKRIVELEAADKAR